MSHLVPLWYQLPTHSFTVTSLQTVASPSLNNSLHYNFSSLQYNCKPNANTGGPLSTTLVPITHTQLLSHFTTNCCEFFTSNSLQYNFNSLQYNISSLQYNFSSLQYNFSSIALTVSPAQQFTTVNRYICSECHFRENRLKASQWLNIHKRFTGSISVYASQWGLLLSALCRRYDSPLLYTDTGGYRSPAQPLYRPRPKP